MQTMTWIGIGTFILVTCFFSACYDTVTRRYETRSLAEADRLFERGWLPQIIPESSFDILTENDLGLNLSKGEFSFSAQDIQSFKAQLEKVDASEISEKDRMRFLERDYWPYRYKAKGFEWVFFIHSEKTHCKYRMRPLP